MKKFSFLLLGAFLLWTITFALAEEAANTATWATAEVTTWATAEAATWTTAEVSTWTTAEAATWTTAKATTWATVEATTWATAEATTWATAETTTWTTAKTTTWTTAEVSTWTTEKATTWTTAENVDTTTPTISDAAKAKYSEEQIAAYEWALEKGITTMNDIDRARLSDGLTRAELAKMMSQYMTKVLWKKLVDSEKAEYSDVDESLGDLADYIQIAYAYKIMWINADGTPIKNFNPSGKVTRAEYATVFSRVLYGDKYNKSEWNYYEDHLNALKEAGILTNTTPTIQEIRGWVMLMMYRSTNVKSETPAEEWTGEVAEIANPASEYCVAQGGTVNIVKDAEGNESGMCKLADGTEVDEWEYFRANNSENETWSTTEEPTTEESTNAEAWTGEVATGSTLTVTATPNKE